MILSLRYDKIGSEIMAIDSDNNNKKISNRMALLNADSFAERLIIARNNAGLSQKALAEKLQISVQTYNGYETKGYEPKFEILLKLCRILETEPNDLLGYFITTEYADEYAAQHLIEPLPPFKPYYQLSGKNIITYRLYLSDDNKDTVINVPVPYDEFNTIIQVAYATAEAMSKQIARQQKETIFIKQVENQILSHLAKMLAEKTKHKE